MPPNKRKARVLTNLKIAEVNAVDRGAGEGCHVMLRKRDGKPDYEAFFGRIFGVKKRHMDGYPPELCRQFAKNLDVPLDPDEPINPGGDDSDGTRIERGFDDDDRDAELDAGADRNDNDDDDFEKGDTPMGSQLIDLAKRHGWRTVCKNFIEGGSASDVFSETEVTQLLTFVAKRAFPDQPPDVAFAKLYSASDADGELARRATQAARDAGFLSRTSKAQPQFSSRSSEPFHAAGAVDGPAGKPGRASLTPRVTGGRAATRVDNPRSALDQLNELADAQRRQHTELTEAGAFAMVYADPKNAELVRRERDENRPRATAW